MSSHRERLGICHGHKFREASNLRLTAIAWWSKRAGRTVTRLNAKRRPDPHVLEVAIGPNACTIAVLHATWYMVYCLLGAVGSAVDQVIATTTTYYADAPAPLAEKFNFQRWLGGSYV